MLPNLTDDIFERVRTASRKKPLTVHEASAAHAVFFMRARKAVTGPQRDEHLKLYGLMRSEVPIRKDGGRLSVLSPIMDAHGKPAFRAI